MPGIDFAALVARASLAPSVHNVQPARWRRDGQGAWLAADLSVSLAQGDPQGLDLGLSCGAVAEAMVLALAEAGQTAVVCDLWAVDDRKTLAGHRTAARIDWVPGGDPDPLSRHLAARFTHRGAFAPGPVAQFGGGRQDAVLVTDAPGKAWLAGLHDQAGLQIMQAGPFRQELLGWMRLSRAHRRYRYDGLGREAMRLSALGGLAARLALGPLWPLLNRVGLTPALTAETDATRSAQAIGCFHRPAGESPVTTGRAYLRLWLEATAVGLAGWPMAAVADDPATNAEICARYAIGADRRLVQVIRFGVASSAPPPRARKPLSEVII